MIHRFLPLIFCVACGMLALAQPSMPFNASIRRVTMPSASALLRSRYMLYLSVGSSDVLLLAGFELIGFALLMLLLLLLLVCLYVGLYWFMGGGALV